MRRFAFMSLLVCCALGTTVSRAKDDKKDDKKWVFVDLQPQGNQNLKDDFHGSIRANNLARLPQGEQTLEGIKFKIGDKLIQLTSTQDSVADLPEKVEGIKLNATATKVHILHATAWATEEGALIGEYTINWDDGRSVTIPIEYGKDVLDWWCTPESPEPTRGKVVWKGDNDGAKSRNASIRLYLTTWENPKPDKKIKSIDYSTNKQTPCAPFCVAMTLETK
jgi:hypothetical protein